MKRLILAGMIGVLAVLAVPEAHGANAQKEISVWIDGASIKFDVAPRMIDSSVMVPMRGIFEQLGAEVVWNPQDRSIVAYKGDHTIRYSIGYDSAIVDGEVVPLKTPGVIISGSTLMPLRFVAEALGADVQWDGDTRSVSVASAPKTQAEVVRVQDGMYVELTYRDVYDRKITENVRLAGIAPIRNGSEATGYVKSVLPAGAKVEVDFRGKRDRDLNLWADVYTADGRSVSRELVSKGYATLTLQQEDPALKKQLDSMQSLARAEKLGLWGVTQPYINQPIKSVNMSDGQAGILTTNGQLWVWGQFYEKPTMILEQVVQVEFESDAGIALKEDGTVWVWGYNNAGLWGNGITEYAVTEIPRQVEGLRRIQSIESNHLAYIAVDDQGSIYAWGSNYNGKIGKPFTINDILYPAPYKLEWDNVRDIEIGFEFTTVLKNDGTVWITQKDGTLARVEQLSNIERISANSNSAVLALRKDGTVFGWDNIVGLFGSGGGLTKTPKEISGLRDIVDISAGKYHFFAIDAEGNLFGWGENEQGQLGMASLGDYVDSPTKIQALSPIRVVVADNQNSLFYMSDGTVWGAGRNSYHMFGEDEAKDFWDGLYYRRLTQISL